MAVTSAPVIVGITISGVILSGVVTDYTNVTLIKGTQKVNINLKQSINILTYAPTISSDIASMISPAAALNLLNACTYTTVLIKPDSLTLSLVKNVLQFSGQPGGGVPEPTIQPVSNPIPIQISAQL